MSESSYTTNIYFSRYQIQTTVTDQATVVDNWVQSFQSGESGENRVVGLDCEWKPFYGRGRNRTALLQLCVGTKCLIIQLCYLRPIPQSLFDFLRNPNNYFVGVGIDADIEKLSLDYGLSCTSSADLQVLARQRWEWSNASPGLKDILYAAEGISMEKPRRITMSNWEMRYLTDEQVQYAAIDAFASYKIGFNLRNYI
ncbi:3'-5' exonuclease [Linum perenne]